jgi:uncharacterized protein (TIGR03089 family)
MRDMVTLAQARAATLRRQPAAPFLTDRTQGRVELSHATFDNWVTKIVNFLHLEADVAPGAAVTLNLPLHWMTAVWCVGVWEAGADVRLDGTGDLTVGTADSDVVVLPDPLGMAAVPAGMTAEWFFPADVRGMPDQRITAPSDPGAVPGMTASELHAAATAFAREIGLQAGGRLRTQRAPRDLPGLLALVGAPLAVGAGVVLGEGEEVTAAV